MAKTPMVQFCEQCDEPFMARRSTARFCGGTCRQKANRAKAAVPPSADPKKDLKLLLAALPRLMDGVNPDVLDLPDCAILICQKHWEDVVTMSDMLEETEEKVRKGRSELRKVRKENRELKGGKS